MSFVKHESVGGGKFCYVNKGKIVTYVDKQRVEHDGVRGHVCAVDFEMGNYQGKEFEKLVLHLVDSDNETHILSFPLESGYGSAFCKMAKNVNWAKPVEISTSLDEKNGKKYGSLFIKQPNADGTKWENLKWAYTEKEPGKMPPAKIVKLNGKDVKDFEKRNEFFRNTIILKLVGPAVKKAYPNYDATAVKKKIDAVSASDITEPIDDLPF